MTQHEKIVSYLVDHPKQGMTIRDGVMLGINWPHKRIRELEAEGLKVKRIDIDEDGKRYRRYILADRMQGIDYLRRRA